MTKDRQLNLRISDAMYLRLENYCFETNQEKSDFIRELIANLLDDSERIKEEIKNHQNIVKNLKKRLKNTQKNAKNREVFLKEQSKNNQFLCDFCGLQKEKGRILKAVNSQNQIKKCCVGCAETAKLRGFKLVLGGNDV